MVREVVRELSEWGDDVEIGVRGDRLLGKY